MQILNKDSICLLTVDSDTLSGANLRGANLYGADLRDANLYGANLRGANLCDANLRDANLYGANFYEDMGPRPQNTSLDRIEPSKGYFKENCRWATPREQIANLSRFRAPIKFNEVTKETEEWIEEFGVNRETFKARVLRGLGFKEALLITTDIVVLEVRNKQQTIYHLDSFLRKTGFDKEEVAALLDSDHSEPYHGFIIRYLTGFTKWPEKYRVRKTAS